MIEIVNMLATGDLKSEIDLRQLSKDTEHTEYDPAVFAGLIFSPVGDGTLTIFYSGKYNITGVSDEKSIKRLENDFHDVLQELDIPLDNTSTATVQNIVCTGDLEHEVDLRELSTGLGVSNVEYEPEQNPFLIYRPELEQCVMTIASTGKIVITGVTQKSKAKNAFINLSDRISQMKTNHDN